MADINITEQQYSIVKQPYRELYCKVNLLNYQFQVVDEISGVVINDSWTISATSDIRRTGTLTLTPDDEEAYRIQAGSKIFLDKYVQVFIGIKDETTNEIIYNNMGIYLINNPTHTFDSTTNTISLQLVDLMAKLTGLRNGALTGYEYQLKEGQSVREVIIAVLAEAGFYNYNIDIRDEDYQTVQFDMSVDGTNTLYDILKTLNENQYINYQMYFDVNGIFHFNRIPMGNDDTVMVDDDIWQYAYISHDVTTNYESLKNDIVVLGKTHTATNYATCTYADATFTLTCAGLKRERDHMKVAFTTPSDFVFDPTIEYWVELNGWFHYPLRTNNGSMVILRPNTYYVIKMQNLQRWDCKISGVANATTYTVNGDIKDLDSPSDLNGTFITLTAKGTQQAISEGCVILNYDETNKTIRTSKTISSTAIDNRMAYIYKPNSTGGKAYWQFMGEYQPRAEVKDENPESPFYVNGSVGNIRIVLSGGEYDNISTNELALERAKWELYTRDRLLDNLNLTCLPIYWLDVNWLIDITLPTEKQKKRFITKEITISNGVTATQTVTLMSFYNFYETEESPLQDENGRCIVDSDNDMIITVKD